MKCRSCGIEIAEKAIVCFRCGTPTAEAVAVPRPTRPTRPGWPLILVALGVLALAIGLAVVFL